MASRGERTRPTGLVLVAWRALAAGGRFGLDAGDGHLRRLVHKLVHTVADS
jgi:hypothetical protein